MNSVIFDIEYDGTNYKGWQFQPNAKTIQAEIENSLKKIFNQPIKIIGSGRTDSGVHAKMQIANAELPKDISIPENKLPNIINANLNPDIRIKKAKYTDHNFHSRFDAKKRTYKYYFTTRYSVFNRNYKTFIKYPLNINKLIDSCDLFIGEKDFTTFSKYNPDKNNPVCNVTECKWEILSNNDFVLSVTSNHFLYGMMRSIAGTCIDIARAKRNKDEISDAFEKKDRNLNSPLTQPNGLFLYFIDYGYDIFK